MILMWCTKIPIWMEEVEYDFLKATKEKKRKANKKEQWKKKKKHNKKYYWPPAVVVTVIVFVRKMCEYCLCHIKFLLSDK